ncbi:MAG: glycine zipper domain-containing protein [Bacteroidota bacterium]
MAEIKGSTNPAQTPSKVLQIEIMEGAFDVMNKTDLAKGIAVQAFTNAIISGISDMAKEGNLKLDEWEDGKINGSEYVVKVVGKGLKSASFSGSKTVAALSIKEVAKFVTNRLGKETLKRFARSNTMTAVAFGMVDQGVDTFKYVKGDIGSKQYKVSTLQNLGSAGGAVGGAATGAALGSAVPGLGTVLGAAIGTMLGSYGGSIMGKSLGEDFFEEEGTELKNNQDES